MIRVCGSLSERAKSVDMSKYFRGKLQGEQEKSI